MTLNRKVTRQENLPAIPKGVAASMPTPRELNCLLALGQYGTSEKAAEAIGISGTTLRGVLFGLRQKLGAESTVQAFWMLSKGFVVSATVTMTVELVTSEQEGNSSED
jgi:hypothetical protein